jgi:hypothetical protein
MGNKVSEREAVFANGSELARQLILVVCAWLLFCVIAAFELGLWPRTAVGWALTLGLGPIAYFVFALAVELGMRMVQRVPWVSRSRDWVERRTVRKRFSWLRVGYLLAGYLCVLLVVLASWLYSESHPGQKAGRLEQFIARHFQ